MSLSDQIDELYRGPLGGFTAARNALARGAGSQRAAVMALEKPSAAAWAVNQLYWHDRKLFDGLARASEARRRAHVQRIGGSTTSVAERDARYRDALAAASDAALARLRDSGAAISPTTATAITQTLEAVPSPAIAGRLSRPVEPAGFSILAEMVAAAPRAVSTRGPADVVHIGRAAPTASKTASDKAQRKARQQAAAALRTATARERRATAALAAAREAVRRADRLTERLDAQLRKARADADARRDDVERASAAVNDAAAARIDAERRLRAID